MIRVRDFVRSASDAFWTELADRAPWEWTHDVTSIVARLAARVGADFQRSGDVAVHVRARVEVGARILAPAVVGPDCFVAATALVRGGCWLDAGCTLGPGVELKSSFLFAGSCLAHFNFVGDSVLGSDVNLEAGAVIANHRNERTERRIHIRVAGTPVDTGVEKFGALVGDGARIGANAVIAPGALLPRGAIVDRLALVDQCPDRSSR
jgi:NDP-sugar pyrophosphorylase family protein